MKVASVLLLFLNVSCFGEIYSGRLDGVEASISTITFSDGSYQITAATIYSTMTYYGDGISILKTGTTFYTNSSSVTLQGNGYSIASLSASTATLSLSTISLQSQLNAMPTTYVNVTGDVMSGPLTINSTATFGGAVAYPFTTTYTSTTLDTTHYTVEVFTTSGTVVSDITISLPDATTCIGRIYNVHKADNTIKDVIIDPYASQLINGETTGTIRYRYTTISIQSTGRGWIKL